MPFFSQKEHYKVLPYILFALYRGVLRHYFTINGFHGSEEQWTNRYKCTIMASKSIA